MKRLDFCELCKVCGANFTTRFSILTCVETRLILVIYGLAILIAPVRYNAWFMKLKEKGLSEGLL